MAGFNRFGGGGLGSLYAGMNNMQQNQSSINRRDDRFDERRNARNTGAAMSTGFDQRRDDRDFARLQRDPSPRRRRYSPDPSYNSMRGNRRDDRGDLGNYSMDHMGGRDNFNSRGQRSSDTNYNRAGRNLGPPTRGDGILGAKPGDMPRDLASNTSSGGGGGMNSQLQQQQQQLMAMVQTQSLLAAIQAQASAAAKRGGAGGGGGGQPPSLMQGMRLHNDNRGYMDNRQNRKRRMSPNRGQMRNRNQQGFRQQQRPQNQRWQNRGSQGNRINQNQRRDRNRNRPRMSESSKKSDDNEAIEEPYIEENLDDDEEDVEAKEEKVETKEPETKEAETPTPTTEEPTEKTEESSKDQPTLVEEKSDGQTDELSQKSSINLAGQNVDQLVKSLFDTHRRKYVCKVCKIMCTKEMCFKQHLFGRRHVKTWLESQGRSFEAEIFRKASEEAAKTLSTKEQSKPSMEETDEAPKEEKEITQETEESIETKDEQPTTEPPATVTEEPDETKKEATPPPIPEPTPVLKVEKKVQVLDVKYCCDTRKMAVRDGDYITISCIVESRVKINGFDNGINTEGCEFVKAVSGFQCRLCKSFIVNGPDVMKHVRGRKHQSNYRQYIHERPKYEANQRIRNKELADMLSEKEGDSVLLYEVSDEEEEFRRPSRYRGSDGPLNVKVTKYIVATDEEAASDPPVEDKVDEQSELRQEDSHDQSKNMDDVGEDDGGGGDGGGDGDDDDDDAKEAEKDDSHVNDQDVNLEPEDLPEDDQKIDEAIQETEEEKENDEMADTSLEAETSLSDIAKELLQDEEPLEKKVKVTPTGRRGRKAPRGGGQGRGRGRGRGGKRNTRHSPKTAIKPELSSDEQLNEQDDVDFMDGFEVIDEVADDEI